MGACLVGLRWLTRLSDPGFRSSAGCQGEPLGARPFQPVRSRANGLWPPFEAAVR